MSLLIAVALAAAMPAGHEPALRVRSVEPIPFDINRDARLLKHFHPARFRVRLENLTREEVVGTLAAQVVGHLDTIYPLAGQRVELAPGEKRSIVLAWNPPGPVTFEGMPAGPVRVPGAVWGLELQVAWLDSSGRVGERGKTVFVVDRDGTSDQLATELAQAETLTPKQAFALRYSGYLNNPAFVKIDPPTDPVLTLDAGKADEWRFEEPSGMYLVRLAPSSKAATANLDTRAVQLRLRKAWLIDPEQQKAIRLYQRSNQRHSAFEVPPVGRDARLVLETTRSQIIASVPLAEIASKGEKQFGKFRDLLAEDGKPITTPAAWEVHRKKLRSTIRQALGSAPMAKSVPLEPKVISVESIPAGVHINGYYGPYTRRKVSLRINANERMNVWLLIPPGIGPFPAVLACHQTVAEGKDEVAGLGGVHTQVNFGPFLASRGFVVLAADSPTVGERYDADRQSAWDTSEMEAKDPDWCLMGQRLHDHQRCLDYLEMLPFVDGKRIGAIGHSLGGESVQMLMAMDDRIAAAALSCPGLLIRSLEKAGEIYAGKGHVILPPSMRKLLDAPIKDRKLPFDIDDCMALWAPRPVFFHDVTDELPHWNNAVQTAQALQALQRVYEFHRAGDRLHVHYSAQAHCFPQWVQADAFDWLEYWLKR